MNLVVRVGRVVSSVMLSVEACVIILMPSMMMGTYCMIVGRRGCNKGQLVVSVVVSVMSSTRARSGGVRIARVP